MSSLHFRRQIGVVLLALLAAALFGESAFAARLLNATVEVDGQLVLQTAYSDSGTEKRETVWRYLATEPGWAETAKIQPDEADPQRARLHGKIVIRVQHTDRPIVEVQATELELTRIGSPGDRWFLPAAEVERIAAANGIAPPPVSRLPGGGMALALIAGLIALAGAIGLLVWLAWPRRPAPDAAGP